MRWLGINWDYGPDKPGPYNSCLQSDRLEIYKKYALKLVEKGLAYPDPYSTEQVEQFAMKQLLIKNLFCLESIGRRTRLFGTVLSRFDLRYLEVKRYEWEDVVRGKLTAGPEMLDDIIIMKADGYPTYNFAHIIDDLEMKVTHVMRGEEFIASTPKFLSLYDALEIEWPTFVTLPPILGPDGKKKLSKRDGAKDLLEYRSEGYLPEAMINLLALIGWNPGDAQEIFTEKNS